MIRSSESFTAFSSVEYFFYLSHPLTQQQAYFQDTECTSVQVLKWSLSSYHAQSHICKGQSAFSSKKEKSTPFKPENFLRS